MVENSARSAASCWRPITPATSLPSIMAAKAWATSGWNWVPALWRSSVHRLGHAQRGPVGALRGHRVVAVGRNQHVRLDRDLALRYRVVAAPVVALVVQLRVEGDLLGEPERRQQPRRQPRVAADRPQLRLGQPSLLRQRGHVDRHLAEVVEAGGVNQPGRLAVGQRDRLGESGDQIGDPLRVLRGQRIAFVDDAGEGIQRRLRLALQALVAGLGLVQRRQQRQQEGQDRPRLRRVAERQQHAQAALADALADRIAQVVPEHLRKRRADHRDSAREDQLVDQQPSGDQHHQRQRLAGADRSTVPPASWKATPAAQAAIPNMDEFMRM